MSVEQSLDYLASAECFYSLRSDPYWPKWNSPWWHMVLLWELGQARKIPKAACDAMMESMDRAWERGYLPSELPEDANRQTDMACFCGAGIMEQVLRAAGADFDGSPAAWLRAWPLKYVLPDGGVNCDEAPYLEGGSRKSSYQSTIAVAEAVLSRPQLSAEETAFLDGAAQYFMSRKMFRTSGGEVVDLGWLQPKFPRFYDYDVLRGLRFLARWKKRLDRPVPPEAVAEALKGVAAGPGETKGPGPFVSSEPADCLAHPRTPGGPDGPPATRFALLDEMSKAGPNAILTAERDEVRAALVE